jgi:hypothetical protein
MKTAGIYNAGRMISLKEGRGQLADLAAYY